MSRLLPHITIEELSAYADLELSPAERQIAFEHIQQCHTCLQTVHELQGTKALMHALPVPAAPHSFGIAPAMQRTYTHIQHRLRILQYAGNLAAILGIFLFCSLLVPLATQSNSTGIQSALHVSSTSPRTSAIPPGTGAGSTAVQQQTNLHSTSSRIVSPTQLVNTGTSAATTQPDLTQPHSPLQWVLLPITRILFGILLILGSIVLWSVRILSARRHLL